MNTTELTYCNVLQWRDAGFKGQGIKIAVQEVLGSTIMNLPRYAGKVIDVHGGRFGNTPNTHIQGVVDYILTVAPEVEIHLLSGTTKQNLQYCIDHSIDLYNYSVDGGWNNPEDNALEAIAQANGTLFGCAAGNRYTGGGLTTNAQKPNWISTGAVQWKTWLGVEGPYPTSYSSSDLSGTDLDTMGFAEGILIPDERDGSLRSESGTSFAHPWVTGLCALWKQWFFKTNNRKPTFDECFTFIKSNSVDIEAPGYDLKSGWGVLRLPQLPRLTPLVIEVTQGSTAAKVNGVPYTLLTPSKVIDGRTMLALRDISNIIGGTLVLTGQEIKITVLPQQ